MLHNATSPAATRYAVGAVAAVPRSRMSKLRSQESAQRWLDLIGGADKAVAAAQTAYDQGDYRWAAEAAVVRLPDGT